MDIIEEIKKAQKSEDLIPIGEVEVPEQYRKYAEDLATLVDITPVELVTPLNLELMQQLWMANPDITPEFEYDEDLLMKTSYLRNELKEFGVPKQVDGEVEAVMQVILASRYGYGLAMTDMAEGILNYDAKKARHAVSRIYGTLHEEIAQVALKHADSLAKRKSQVKMIESDLRRDAEMLERITFDAHEIKRWFGWALNLYGFTDWEILIDNDTFIISIEVTGGRKRIYIPATRMVNGVELMQLVGHEIETHVRDIENGAALFGVVGGGTLRAADATIAEGHALLEDMRFYKKFLGEIRRAPKPWYIMAMDNARRGDGFARVTRELQYYLMRSGQSEERAKRNAWKYAYRVYRGSQDLNPARGHDNVFVFPKDKAYFEGYFFAKKLADAGLEHFLEIGMFRPKELMEIARVVKITPEDIPYKKLNAVDQLYGQLLVEKLII